VLLALQRRWAFLVVLTVLLSCLLVYKPSLVASAEPYVLRGQTFEQAKGLNSRVSWWTAGLAAWREAPLVGKGLLTGTRFEVLPQLGRTETSSIHGTWIEALVGTGAIGCGLLALAYLTALGRAIRSADQFAVLMLALIGVRSLTGSSIESFSAVVLLFLVAALGPHRWECADETVCEDAEKAGSLR
jgi:O-antigen ligase